MDVGCQMHISNLSPSLSFTDTTKSLTEVNQFIINAVLSPDTGDLQFPSFGLGFVLGFHVFLMVGARLRVLRGARDCVTKCAPLGKMVCSLVVAEVWQKAALHGGGLFVHPTTKYCTRACSQSFLVTSCMAFVF